MREQSSLQETAHAQLRKRFVALLLEPRDGVTKPYPHSGFLVEVANSWYWVTASHCARCISEALAKLPTAAIALALSTDGNCSKRIDVERSKWSIFDGQAALKHLAQAHPDLGITDRDIELFDVAIWPIPDTTQCYLLAEGSRAFTEEEAIAEPEALIELTCRQECAIFAAGIPEATHGLGQTGMMEMRFMVLPLHPDPDDDREDCDKRKVHFEGTKFAWMPTAWRDGSFGDEIVGCSGGPVVIASGERIFLAGVVARQKPYNGPTEFVGIADVQSALRVIRSI